MRSVMPSSTASPFAAASMGSVGATSDDFCRDTLAWVSMEAVEASSKECEPADASHPG